MGVLHITPRSWWNAKSPENYIPPMQFPIRNVFFTYTKGKYAFAEIICQKELQRLQDKHIERGASDIIYSFVIGGSGKIYEARGWNVTPKLGKKYSALTDQSILVAFTGIFKGTMPTAKMMRAGDWLIKLGMRRGLVSTKFVEYRIAATGYEGYTTNKFEKKL